MSITTNYNDMHEAMGYPGATATMDSSYVHRDDNLGGDGDIDASGASGREGEAPAAAAQTTVRASGVFLVADADQARGAAAPNLPDDVTMLFHGETSTNLDDDLPPVPSSRRMDSRLRPPQQKDPRTPRSVGLPTMPFIAPELPSPPFVVEPTHFHTNASVEMIVCALAISFTNHDIAYTSFCTYKCKFTCVYYCDGEDATEFVARVFRISEHQQLIEFQHRSGSRIGFCRAYDAIGSDLNDIIDASAPRSAQSFHQFKPRRRRTISSQAETTETESQVVVPENNATIDDDGPLPPLLHRPMPLTRQTTGWWPTTEEEIEHHHSLTTGEGPTLLEVFATTMSTFSWDETTG